MPEFNVVSSNVPMGKALPRFGPGGNNASGSGGSSVSTVLVTDYVLYGSGSPEGVEAAPVGALYSRLDTGGFWNKLENDGEATGWQELIQ